MTIMNRTERMHPTWCDLGPECKREDNTDAIGIDNRLHAGRVTAFYPERDDYRGAGPRRARGAPLPDTGVDGSRPSVVLALAKKGLPSACSAPSLSSVSLSAEDARFLAGQLVGYASQVERDPVWMPESEFTWKPEAQR